MQWRTGGLILLILLLLGGVPCVGTAQPAPDEDAWTPILETEGVHFSYVFYEKADNHSAGIVMMLRNTNAYAVRYRFRVVFRSGEEEVEEVAEGTLAAHTRKTGDRAGLFWIPFADNRPITEVGLRGYHIEPL